jgi:aminoglycoside 2'-N-acetyltransferase I
MRLSLTRVHDLNEDDRAGVHALSLAVYPPEEWADWPGRTVEWTDPDWCILVREDDAAVVSYTGVVLRDAILDGRSVRVGGVGGIKTHPAARGRGYARVSISAALDFFRTQGDVGFALLVCEPHLLAYYSALGWREFRGRLLVLQHGETREFTFNRVMTHDVGSAGPVAGTIDLHGPPW